MKSTDWSKYIQLAYSA